MLQLVKYKGRTVDLGYLLIRMDKELSFSLWDELGMDRGTATEEEAVNFLNVYAQKHKETFGVEF